MSSVAPSAISFFSAQAVPSRDVASESRAPFRQTSCRSGGLNPRKRGAMRDVVAGDLPARRRRRGASLLACCRRLCSTARVRAGMVPPGITAPTRAGQPAPAAGAPCHAASAEAERHDGRQDALGGSRAVSRGAARAVEPARGARGVRGQRGMCSAHSASAPPMCTRCFARPPPRRRRGSGASAGPHRMTRREPPKFLHPPPPLGLHRRARPCRCSPPDVAGVPRGG